MKKYTLRIRANDRPVFDALKSGQKSWETRAATTKFREVSPGDELVFICQGERFTKPVQSVRQFPTVEAMLEEINWREIAPWLKSREELKYLYLNFPGYPEKIAEFGILAFS